MTLSRSQKRGLIGAGLLALILTGIGLAASYYGSRYQLRIVYGAYVNLMVVLALQVFMGNARITNLSHSAFMGIGAYAGCSHARRFSGFDPFTGNLRFCWLSVAHTVMQVSWTSGQTYSRAPRTDFIPAMCPCALLVLMSAYAGTG